MPKQYVRPASGPASGIGAPGRSGSTRWLPSWPWLVALALLAVLSLLPYPYAPSGDFEVLPSQRADVRALAGGDVREVLAKEGDRVTAGQAIARLDDTAARAKVAAAEAETARLRADLALARKGAKAEEIEVARQRVATARSAANLAAQQAARVTSAYKGKSVTAQEYERAIGAADVARQQLVEAQSALGLISSPAQNERLKALEADVRRAEADLSFRQQELAWATVTTPIAGQIVASRLQYARGNFLNRGELLAVVEDSGELLAEIRMPEAVMSDIRVDARARARPWAFPGVSFEGTVTAISPVAEEGQYGRVVRVQMVVSDPEQRLKTGMTGNAKVSAGTHPAIVVFTRALLRFFRVEVWSWLP